MRVAAAGLGLALLAHPAVPVGLLDFGGRAAVYRNGVAVLRDGTENARLHLRGEAKRLGFAGQVHEDVLNQAERENEAAIERLNLCTEADTWPTGYAELRVFDIL